MPTPAMTPEKVAEVMRRYEVFKAQGLSQRDAAREMGMNANTLRTYISKHAPAAGYVARKPEAELDIPRPPDASEPIEDLVARRKAAYRRTQESEAWHRLVPIRVRERGPVAICAVGDPHVDDDGCDLGQLEHDMTVIGRTKGMFALHVGDVTNNWVGRLGRLYAHQTTKASDGIRLTEWMFGMAPPLAVVAGNHDIWNEGMNWLNFVVKQAGPAILQEHGVRLNLQFPGGQSLRIHTRHDFPGHSQFNPLHGLRKEHLFGLRDHVNIAGHKHTDSFAGVPSPDGYVQWMLRVSGYKAHDDYAKQLNLQPMKMGPTCALIVDPDTKHHAELVKPFWDLDEAADYLTFKRRRCT